MIENGMILAERPEREPDMICDECGEPMWFDDCYYEFGGECFCEECVKRHKHIVMPQ